MDVTHICTNKKDGMILVVYPTLYTKLEQYNPRMVNHHTFGKNQLFKDYDELLKTIKHLKFNYTTINN